MKSKPTSIETLLESGKELSLTDHERSLMLSELKSYATLHTPQEASPQNESTPRYIPLYTKWWFAVTSVILFMFGTGFASTESLPGEPLYFIKVSIVEPVIGLTNTAESDQLYYQVSLIEKRVEEIQELSRIQKFTETEMRIIEKRIEDHATEIEEIFVEQEKHESITKTDSLEAMSDVRSALKSEEVMASKITNRGLNKRAVAEKMDARYMAELENLASSSPDEAMFYIEEVLDEISEKTASTSPAAHEIRDYLTDVSEALEKGALREALIFTGEAQQTADVNELLEELREAESVEY